MKERGLFWVKPDAVLAGELETAKQRIQQSGLEIQQEHEIQPTNEQVQQVYKDKQDRLSQYWEGYLTTMPSVLLEVVGEAASQQLRQIRDSLRDELRYDGFYTGFHTSDNSQEAVRELSVLTK